LHSVGKGTALLFRQAVSVLVRPNYTDMDIVRVSAFKLRAPLIEAMVGLKLRSIIYRGSEKDGGGGQRVSNEGNVFLIIVFAHVGKVRPYLFRRE